MDKVKQKIIELVPEIVERHGGEHEPIQLADVLRAVNYHHTSLDEENWGVVGGDCFFIQARKSNKDVGYNWDVRTDYDHQTQEVKDFIGRLLGVNK